VAAIQKVLVLRDEYLQNLLVHVTAQGRLNEFVTMIRCRPIVP